MIYNYNVVLTHKVLARLSVVLGANVCTGVRTTNNAQIRFNQQRRQKKLYGFLFYKMSFFSERFIT